jgi:uncharacterized protein HemY
MNDSITDWRETLSGWIVSGLGLLVLFAFGLLLIAPVFGPYIKARKRREYIMLEDYEARTNAYMRIMYPILWTIAILGWAAVFYCYIHR